jgi:hypothetical protein
MLHFIRAAQDYLCERIEFKPEYLNMMKDEVESGNRVQNGPSFGISLRDDVLNFDILDGFRHALWSMFQHVLPTDQSEIKALLKPKKDKKTNSDTTLTGEKKLGNFSGSSAQTRMNHARGIEHEYDVGSKNDTALPEDTIKKPPNKVISVLEHNDSLL